MPNDPRPVTVLSVLIELDLNENPANGEEDTLVVVGVALGFWKAGLDENPDELLPALLNESPANGDCVTPSCLVG